MDVNALYSLDNARRYRWSSVTGELNPERVARLNACLVGTKVLDAGCGGGAYVEYLARRGFDVTGCDKHMDFLDVARARASLGHYMQEDLTALKFPDKTFDFTYCLDVLEHVDDRAAIRELARVTRKRLLLAVPRTDDLMHRFSLTFFHYSDHTHLRTYTEESFGELLATVNPVRMTVHPELTVPARELTAELLQLDQPPPPRSKPGKRLQRRLLDRLLGKAIYRSIPTGLVAVVDLEEGL